MADARSAADAYYGALKVNDFGGAAGTVREGAVVEVPGATLKGPEQFLGWMEVFFAAFPDLTHEISYTTDGDNVRADVTARGTHTGPLVSPEGTIQATGRPIEIVATNEARVEGDKIAAMTISFDQANFMEQLGLA
jgi:predicted ester cyclase